MNRAKIYYNKLKLGEISFDKIPKSCQALVIELGKADVASGVITEEQFEMLFGIPYEEGSNG